jgi:hypothetical protein
LEIILGFAIVAVALVALNFGLQRLARPDKAYERIVGCCGMALPEEMLRLRAETQAETQPNQKNEGYHER